MILSGKEIKNRLGKEIFINPFNENQLNPNSYNLRLHNKLLVYDTDSYGVLDMKVNNFTKEIIMDGHGYVLQPNKVYLGRTVERTKTINLIPGLEGRSSVARLGLYVHITAGFGDVGFEGYWTLELHCVEPIRIYPDVEMCQIFYNEIKGDYDNYNSIHKYQNNNDVQASMLYKDFLN